MPQSTATKHLRDDLTPEEQEFLDRNREEVYQTLRTVILRFKDIKHGDLVTINFPANIKDQQLIIAVEQAQRLADEYKCEIMVLAAGMNVNHIPAETMKAAGWIRDPDFKQAQGTVN
jgi:hypothetical protein